VAASSDLGGEGEPPWASTGANCSKTFSAALLFHMIKDKISELQKLSPADKLPRVAQNHSFGLSGLRQIYNEPQTSFEPSAA